MSNTFSTYATVAYDGASGSQLWVAGFGDASQDRDAARAIAIDSLSGNVYVTGTVGRGYGVTPNSYGTVAYDRSGTQLWADLFGGPDAFAEAIAVGDSGNIYVTGSASSEFGTVAYDPAGTLLWSINSPAPAIARAVKVDGSGNVYVTGVIGSSENSEYLTIKYSQP